MIQYFVALTSAFPDFHKSIDDMVAEADKVVVRSTIQGTRGGTFAGILATRKHVSTKGSEIFKIEGTKILESWEFSDYLDLMTQLGAIPSIASER
jgi:predicted ester cyclase